jgi:hypothetical protein
VLADGVWRAGRRVCCLLLRCVCAEPFCCQLHPATTNFIAASDSLAGSSHCANAPQARKEFGKTKLYIPSQEGLAALDPTEAAQRQEDIKRLQAECQGADSEVAALRKGRCCVLRCGGWSEAVQRYSAAAASDGCWRHRASA